MHLLPIPVSLWPIVDLCDSGKFSAKDCKSITSKITFGKWDVGVMFTCRKGGKVQATYYEDRVCSKALRDLGLVSSGTCSDGVRFFYIY
jgi:hypothetical protein